MRATYPLDIEPAVEAPTQSDPASLSTALAIGLSAAAIQARVIFQMARLDSKETRDMFLRMTPPAVERPDCSNDRYTSHRAYYAHLRFESEERQGTPAWNDEALEFLNKLERWSRELGQSNREHFFQKAEWYGAFVYATPDGKLRQLFLDSYVKFLAGSPVRFITVRILLLPEKRPVIKLVLNRPGGP